MNRPTDRHQDQDSILSGSKESPGNSYRIVSAMASSGAMVTTYSGIAQQRSVRLIESEDGDFVALLGKNIGQQYCWCSLMWLMPLRSLSNCDYELNFYLRLILGPIHSNQVMGMDPVGSYHGTRNSRSNSINPTYPYQSHD